MIDYKELIEQLRFSWSFLDYDWCELTNKAADAIEELVTKCQQLEKERDEALKEIRIYHKCYSCRYSNNAPEKEPCLSCNQC